jgi:hypothetical protein
VELSGERFGKLVHFAINYFEGNMLPCPIAAFDHALMNFVTVEFEHDSDYLVSGWDEVPKQPAALDRTVGLIDDDIALGDCCADQRDIALLDQRIVINAPKGVRVTDLLIRCDLVNEIICADNGGIVQ